MLLDNWKKLENENYKLIIKEEYGYSEKDPSNNYRMLWFKIFDKKAGLLEKLLRLNKKEDVILATSAPFSVENIYLKDNFLHADIKIYLNNTPIGGDIKIENWPLRFNLAELMDREGNWAIDWLMQDDRYRYG